jgi:hypothetical protein
VTPCRHRRNQMLGVMEDIWNGLFILLNGLAHERNRSTWTKIKKKKKATLYKVGRKCGPFKSKWTVCNCDKLRLKKSDKQSSLNGNGMSEMTGSVPVDYANCAAPVLIHNTNTIRVTVCVHFQITWENSAFTEHFDFRLSNRIQEICYF